MSTSLKQVLIFSAVSSPKGCYIPPEHNKQYYQQSQDKKPIPQAVQQPQQGRKGSSLIQTPFLGNLNVFKTY